MKFIIICISITKIKIMYVILSIKFIFAIDIQTPNISYIKVFQFANIV